MAALAMLAPQEIESIDEGATVEEILAELDNVKAICAEIRAEEFTRWNEHTNALAAFAAIIGD